MNTVENDQLTNIMGGSKRSFRNGWEGRSYAFVASNREKHAFGKAFIHEAFRDVPKFFKSL